MYSPSGRPSIIKEIFSTLKVLDVSIIPVTIEICESFSISEFWLYMVLPFESKMYHSCNG